MRRPELALQRFFKEKGRSREPCQNGPKTPEKTMEIFEFLIASDPERG